MKNQVLRSVKRIDYAKVYPTHNCCVFTQVNVYYDYNTLGVTLKVTFRISMLQPLTKAALKKEHYNNN